ncbi:MAG TPA: hypothetical protein VN829_15510 [Dongiaceae bacterium]|nr:hypothetical protein [Dongiaceae bacterium]
MSSTLSDDYARTKLRDGSFQSETYAFGDGGHFAGAARDDSIDRLTFMDVARVIAVPLARRNYLPADGNPEKTKLLIMVYWGTTGGAAGSAGSNGVQKLQASQASLTSAPPPPADAFSAHCTCDATQLNTNIAAMVKGAGQDQFSSAFAVVAAENKARYAADLRNAALLGYDLEPAAASGLALRNRQEDLVAEIEVSRDFVVLKAYDFQALWKHKKHTLLWATRMSVREQGTNFGMALPALVANASQFFGEDSHGLRHRDLPEGHVEIGEVNSLGVVQEK